MKYLLILFSLGCKLSFVQAQNYFLRDGEYMDTATINDLSCPNLNYYYYHIGGKYPESSYTLLKKTQTFLKTSDKGFDSSGYITFRFLIECNGKMMRKVQVLQTNDKYQSIYFDKQLVNLLFQFLTTLDKWKSPKSKEGAPISYYAFLTFKIKDGKVCNVIP